MNRIQKDRHLDVPAEANRDKHINYVARERSEIDPSTEPSTGAMAPDTTLDRKSQMKKNKNRKRNKH